MTESTLSRPVNVAIIGCGNISKAYGETLRNYPDIQLIGATDIDPSRAEAYVKEFGGTAYPTLEALLADDDIEIVINLTIHHVHYDVIKQCLQAGKHVYSEKPLALTYDEARELVELAESLGLRLSGAPMVTLGEAQQTAWKHIREGKIGDVRLVYAEVNWARIESWHPNPEPFYAVGPMFDVGVYPLTILTSIFGRIRRVNGFGKILYPDRVTTEGRDFHLTTPDLVAAFLEHENGTVTRLTTNFYVPHEGNKQHGIEFHGDKGSLYLKSFAEFDCAVEIATYGEPYTAVEPVKPPVKGVEWARGVYDLASAIANETPQRITGAQAAHVVEVINAINQSIENQGAMVEVTSDFPAPEPLDWSL